MRRRIKKQEPEKDKKIGNQCKKCVSNNCACNNEVCSYAYKQYGMKKWVYGIIITVISFGLIVSFLSETILTIWFPSASLGLNTWNQFVSIILGIIATTLSVVSMIMSFKNYDDGLVLHEKHIETLEKISLISRDVIDVKEKLDKINLIADAKNETTNIPPKIKWEKEPDTTTM
ncbi:MAG: hypothetical protein J6A75_03495 [Lachnospiraceae bacterium]|nr:hypothetical protein [Lachnospiraceae bacterium]